MYCNNLNRLLKIASVFTKITTIPLNMKTYKEDCVNFKYQILHCICDRAFLKYRNWVKY